MKSRFRNQKGLSNVPTTWKVVAFGSAFFLGVVYLLNLYSPRHESQKPARIWRSKIASLPSPEILFALATRFFAKKEEDFQDFCEWIEQMRSHTSLPIFIAVAINLDKVDAANRLEKRFTTSVEVIRIPVWGLSTVLNALTLKISQTNANVIFFISKEIKCSPDQIAELEKALTPKTLVTGFALPGHEFSEGKHELNALNCPWNTASMWRIEKLQQIGFLMSSEKTSDKSIYGMEEVPTITLIQHLFGSEMNQAKLLRVSGIHWATDFSEDKRRAKHEQKMRSKFERGEKQLTNLNLSDRRAIVQHFDLN